MHILLGVWDLERLSEDCSRFLACPFIRDKHPRSELDGLYWLSVLFGVRVLVSTRLGLGQLAAKVEMMCMPVACSRDVLLDSCTQTFTTRHTFDRKRNSIIHHFIRDPKARDSKFKYENFVLPRN